MLKVFTFEWFHFNFISMVSSSYHITKIYNRPVSVKNLNSSTIGLIRYIISIVIVQNFI